MSTTSLPLQVLDASRSDWWLVLSSESGEQGWVPVSFLEQRVLQGPVSPSPEPFEDDTDELASLMKCVKKLWGVVSLV